jgi:HK97 family phage prohead protease
VRHNDDVPAQVKAAGDEGRFSALVSVFDVIDRAGDRMMAGSFSETLRRWRESAKRIPIVWSHQTDSPDTVIGSADPNDVRETTSGLRVDGVLDIADSSLARRAFELLKNGTISGWSFGYIPKKQKRRNGANESTKSSCSNSVRRSAQSTRAPRRSA